MKICGGTASGTDIAADSGILAVYSRIYNIIEIFQVKVYLGKNLKD